MAGLTLSSRLIVSTNTHASSGPKVINEPSSNWRHLFRNREATRAVRKERRGGGALQHAFADSNYSEFLMKFDRMRAPLLKNAVLTRQIFGILHFRDQVNVTSNRECNY